MKWGFIFLMAIPALLYILSSMFGLRELALIPMKISALIGTIILLFLFVLLTVEIKQDKRINAFYERNRNTKIRISNNFYECQNCGFHKVRKQEQNCPMCGIKFDRINGKKF